MFLTAATAARARHPSNRLPGSYLPSNQALGHSIAARPRAVRWPQPELGVRYENDNGMHTARSAHCCQARRGSTAEGAHTSGRLREVVLPEDVFEVLCVHVLNLFIGRKYRVTTHR